MKAQDDWKRRLSFVDCEVERMKEFGNKKMTSESGRVVDQCPPKDTLPKGLSKKKADEILTEAYDMVDGFIPRVEELGVLRSQLLHLHDLKSFIMR